MNTDSKQKLSILKKYFSSLRKRISLVFSLILALILTGSIISSLFLSDTILQKLAQSQYLQTKVSKVLKQNEIYSEDLISVEFIKFGIADINIEKANFKKFGGLVGYDIKLKVDFIKLWLGLSFIDEISIMEVVYSLPNNLSVNSDEIAGLDVKSLDFYLSQPFNKVYSKSIYVEKGSLEVESEVFEFRNIFLVKNEKSLTARASLDHKKNLKESSFSALVNLTFNDTNILEFNLDLQVNDYNSFFYVKQLPKRVRLFLQNAISDANFLEKKPIGVKLDGAYDLNSTILKFQLSSSSGILGFKSTINIEDSVNSQSLLFKNAELGLRDFSILSSDLNINPTNRTFEVKGTKVFTSDTGFIGFLNNLSIKGIFLISDTVLTKINIIGDDPSSLKASLKIVNSSKGLDDEKQFFDFFVNLDAFQKTNLEEFGFLLPFFSVEEKSGIKLSNANAQVGIKLVSQSIQLRSFKGKIKNLVYLKNNKSFLEFESIDLNGNSQQGYAAINSLTKTQPPMSRYKDIRVEFNSIRNDAQNKEVTVSFKSNLGNLISLTPMPKSNLTWIDFLSTSQGEKEVAVKYSKAFALDKIEDFFTPEGNMFELNIEDFFIPFSAKNSLKLATLNLKGMGDTIFFDGVIAVNNGEISGSIENGLSYIFSKKRKSNLTILIDNLKTKDLFPKFSTFSVDGPVELTFLPVKKEDNAVIRSDIKVTNASVYIPSLALKKMKGINGKLKFDFTKDNKSTFKYSQNDVLVSGNATHESIFEVSKINYSIIKTPDIQIREATFQKFSNYSKFKTNRGTITLDFLMIQSFKKKKMPLDIVFSDIVVTSNRNVFLNSIKGEIRSFQGLRGYAKGDLLSNSNIEIIISPRENNGINLVISGNNAGELLRRGDYYRNGFGGMFKASIFYKNKNQIEGSIEIEDFRLKNAPVLAQIISSASIIGLLDNLNGNGLLFTKIEGNFIYKGNKLTLKDGVAVGPSLGLTMNGFEQYGEKENIVDVRGLVSPVYIINGVVKAIPLIGKIFGGEKGEGVFGVSYKVLGNSSNPRVLVNPLSILTPGAFRKIFSIE